MSDAILRINNLSKTYGAKKALDGVSFEVERGKIYGFIGENGAGKTTAIRAITGLSPIENGTIELFGKSDSKGLAEARRKMGCLVESPILDMRKTAKENLMLQELLYGNKDSAKVDKILARVGLGDVKNKKVGNFSLGMKQRLGIALALINDPELLILDEPVNGLDPMGMVDVRNILWITKHNNLTLQEKTLALHIDKKSCIINCVERDQRKIIVFGVCLWERIMR